VVNLPPITKGVWQKVDEFVGDYEGFYRVSGKVTECTYPIIIKSSSRFNFASGQYVRDVLIPSYELREALRLNEIKIDEITGWVWIPGEDASNPFADYVYHFYKFKNESRNNFPLYTQNKLLLNSLYGKTYQAIRKTDYEEAPEYVRDEKSGRLIKNRILYRAGGLYLPHVGAWITSLCRAKLHEDMHRYEAIDCATDSFKTKQKVSVNNELGGLKPVCEGLLLIIRPKLYAMFSARIQDKVQRVGDLRSYLKQVGVDSLRNGQDLVKVALHGFWGSVYDFLKIFREGKTEYSCQHMTKIRESIRQRKAPRVMETQHRHVRVNWEDEVGLCGFKKKEAIKKMELCCDNCFLCAYR